MERLKKNIGFTLPEIMVSLGLFSVAIILVGSMYLLAQRIYNKSSETAELSQNGRVIMERLARELRQARAIHTSLPLSDNNPEQEPAGEIFFQDGHNNDQFIYLRYYLVGKNIMRSKSAYYFSTDPTNYVAYNTLNINGQPPEILMIEDKIIGEHISGIAFWGTSNYIKIRINLSKNTEHLTMETSINLRN